MIRLILYLVGVGLLATGLAWLADRPGQMVLTWQGYEIETTVFRAVVIFAILIGLVIFLWSLLRQLWNSPAAVGRLVNRRRQERGLEALSSGMIAIGAGDRSQAMRNAIQARKALPNEPLTHLLRAQAAQLSGDRTTARRIFEAMLGTRETEQLGLRGLFLEAEREGEHEAARQFAERALRLNPQLGWPIDALFELQCKASDWNGALDTLAAGKRNGHFERAAADRRRAVILTAQAQALEDTNAEKALALAMEAHNLAPDLVEAAAIAGRLFSSRGQTGKVARVIEQTWKRAPHPDLAIAYAYARPGDSPRDRLERVKTLARTTPHSVEAPIAVASAAIEAHDWTEARKALAPLIESRLSQRVCTLMARIEGEQFGNAGRVREWLARAANAPRDPAWTADGVVAERWAAISPVTGTLDAFQWKVPVEQKGTHDEELALAKLEELIALGARPSEKVIEAKPIDDHATRQTVEVRTVTEPQPKPAASPSAAPGVSAQRGNGTTSEPHPFTPTRPPDDPGIEEDEPATRKGPTTRAGTATKSPA
jgi:HemY protein